MSHLPTCWIRRVFLIAASFALLAAPAPAGDQPAKVDLAKRIAPLVDAQTFAVAHVRLDKVDVGRLVHLAGKVFDLPADEAAMAEAWGKQAMTALADAGAKEAFVVASLNDFPSNVVCIAIPVAGAEEGGKVAVALKAALELQEAPGKGVAGEFIIESKKDFVLIATQNTLKRMHKLQPVLPQHLEKALAAYPTADARLAVVLPDTLRRSLGELMPQLPPELDGGQTAPLIDGFRYFSVGLSLREKASIEAALQTSDAKTATAIHTLLVDLMGKGVKKIAKDFNVDAKLTAHLALIVELLTPRADKEVLTWKLSEDGWIQTIQPLAVKLMASSLAARSTVQSANNLKQIAVAMHSYHDVHKHFPTGIYDKKAKLLLSWRVQILPFLEQKQPYEQFKLDESWDSPHNIKLAKQMPAVFHSPSSKAAADKTSYLVPRGKGLFFDNDAPNRKLQDITDGTVSTIMVLEVDDDHAVTWTRPDDLNVDPKQPMKGLTGDAAGNVSVLFVDGSCQVVNRKFAPADFYKLLRIASGEVKARP